MRIAIALLFVAATTVAHDGGHSSPSSDNSRNMSKAQPEQKPWSPVTKLQNKQDGGEQSLVAPGQQQFLLIHPGNLGNKLVPGDNIVGTSYGYHLPARGEVINTAPANPTDTPQATGDDPASPTINTHTVLQQAGSGVVLQVHSPYLKSVSPGQAHKQHPGIGGGQGFKANPHSAGTQLALQVQPHYLLTGVQNPGLLHKQIQAPIYYTPAPAALNYQNLLNGVKPGQQQVLAAPLQQSQNVLNQYSLPQYTQAYPTVQTLKLQPSVAPPAFGKAPNFGHLHLNGLVQNQVVKPSEQVFYEQTKQNPNVKQHSNIQDTSSDVFPDFGKMFENYFQTAGPFGDSFRKDNPEQGQGQESRPKATDGFHSGTFFGEPEKVKAASTAPQEEDSEFKPCNFFKTANLKVAEEDKPDNEEDDDTEQYSSEKHAARDNSYFPAPRGTQYPRPQESETNNRQRYRGHRDDEEDERPQREEVDDDEDDRRYRPRPSESQRRPNHESSAYDRRPSHHEDHYRNDRHRRPQEDDDDDDRRPNYRRPDERRPNEQRPDERRPNEQRTDERRPNDEEHRPRPHENYYRDPQSSNRHHQEAAPAEKPNKPRLGTFHHYNFPPTPAYVRDIEKHGGEKNRPPPAVKEDDTVGYYTYVAPVVGNNGVYYRSEKQFIANNHAGGK